MDCQILKDFLSKAEPQYNELNNKYKLSQEHFGQCVEYFGEASRTQTPTTFFSTFVKFLKSFNVAKQENEQRLKMQEMDAVASLASSNNSKNPSPQNSLHRQNLRKNSTANEMIEELKKRRGQQTNGAPSNAGGGSKARLSRPQPKEINIEDLIEGLFCHTLFSFELSVLLDGIL